MNTPEDDDSAAFIHPTAVVGEGDGRLVHQGLVAMSPGSRDRRELQPWAEHVCRAQRHRGQCVPTRQFGLDSIAHVIGVLVSAFTSTSRTKHYTFQEGYE
jgi:hypothetical protein